MVLLYHYIKQAITRTHAISEWWPKCSHEIFIHEYFHITMSSIILYVWRFCQYFYYQLRQPWPSAGLVRFLTETFYGRMSCVIVSWALSTYTESWYLLYWRGRSKIVIRSSGDIACYGLHQIYSVIWASRQCERTHYYTSVQNIYLCAVILMWSFI